MDEGRRVVIEGIGHYLPRECVSNDQLAQEANLDAAAIEARTGVRTRYRADRSSGESTPFMAAQAAREALAEAGVAISDVGLIISASGTQHQAVPDTAAFVQAELGAGRSGIACMSMHTSCLSFMSALDVAASLLDTRRYERILIVTAEIASAGLDYSDPETGPLFGDGAAAAVLRRREEFDPLSAQAAIHRMRFETYGDDTGLSGVLGGGTCQPMADPEVGIEAGHFRMRGLSLLRRAVTTVPDFLRALYPELGSEADANTLYVLHQASQAGFNLIQKLGFAPERTVRTLSEYGNCIAASLPLTLHAAIRSGRLQRGQRFLMVGTAAGVTYGGGVFTY